MLRNSQMVTLFALAKREGNLFSSFPHELIKYELRDVAYHPASDISILLGHIAYARKDAAQTMLEANPGLLLEASNAVTPSGLTVIRATPYECALGAGDDDMAAMIRTHFRRLDNGREEEAKQYARYKPAIDGMLTQIPSYNLNPLIEIIKNASVEDVTAALLDKEKAPPSALREALIAFRKHFKSITLHKKLEQPSMHFNYADLKSAYEIYDREFDHLRRDDNFDRCDLVWRQVIGYIQRGMTRVDRQVFAQGLYDVVERKSPLRRSLDFTYGGVFLETASGDSAHDGLGFDCGFSMTNWPMRRENTLRSACARAFTNLISSKSVRLAELMPQPRTKLQQSPCVIL